MRGAKFFTTLDLNAKKKEQGKSKEAEKKVEVDRDVGL